jgi:asparagine synthase (glutamine-hydrolysing)
MCGIGVVIRQPGSRCSAADFKQMIESVAHRGPDGEGTAHFALNSRGLAEVDTPDDWHIALGHRRLSILDLSDAGKQPMTLDGRIWITFNGEVYNYLELRDQLIALGCTFSTGTDTEVILAAYGAWGPDCFSRFRGMFGLAILDGRKNVLVLARDRFGIKPLYRMTADSVTAIASEIKQFKFVPGLDLQPNSTALHSYLLTGYEDAEDSFFANVHPVAAGCWMELSLPSGRVNRQERYWFPEKIPITVHDRKEASESFRHKLIDAVRVHMRSDVPVGCSLSGGLDSSAVLACVSRLRGKRSEETHAFSITYPGHRYDERAFINDVLESIPAIPHYETPTPQDFIRDLDRFVWTHDEPVGHFSQYNGYALAKITRAARVPVILNGQGGDELLAGYWQSLFAYLGGLASHRKWIRLACHLVGAGLPRGNREMLWQIPVMLGRYRSRTSNLFDLGLRKDETEASAEMTSNRVRGILKMSDHERRIFELRSLYLPKLLKWDDRNFMAFAVEGRYPFLDHELVEHTLSFSREVLYSSGWTKEPLRQGLNDMLPASITRRPTKFGFEAPQDDWLVGPLSQVLDRWLEQDAPIWEYVDRTKVLELLTIVRRVNGRNSEPGEMLFRLYVADRWLRAFFAGGEDIPSVADRDDPCAAARGA